MKIQKKNEKKREKEKKHKKVKNHKKDKDYDSDKEDKKDKKDKKHKKDKDYDSDKEDKKHKKGKKGKKDKDKNDNKKKKDKHKDKEKGLKADQIELIQTYLEGTRDSIAKYAVPSRIAIATLPDNQQQNSTRANLGKAAMYQNQTEMCYRYYASLLNSCDMKDKTCLQLYKPIQKQCVSFARNANDLAQSEM